MKDITILLSTYNGEKYIEEQLKSIEDQTISEKIQLVIRDDGSTDNTLKIIEEWNGKIPISIIKGDNIGVIKSFEQLVNNAPKSKYYAFADQDDYWNIDKMEVAISSLEKMDDEKPLLYFCNANLVDERLDRLGYNVHNKSIDLSLSRIMICNPALGCTMFFNEKALELTKKFRFQEFPMHDKLLLVICFLAGKVIYDNEPRMKYRQHLNNVMARKKGILKKVRQSYKLWVKSKDSSIVVQSNELLLKLSEYSEENQIEVLRCMANYKCNFKDRILLLCKYSSFNGMKPKVVLSFKIRVLLGLA